MPIPSMLYLVLDFETHWDRDYSLSKMTTHEYIHDHRFEVQSVAVQVVDPDERRQLVGEATVAGGETCRDLLEALPWSRIVLIGHNLHFDAAVLRRYIGVTPAFYVDTMMLAMAVLGGRLKSASLKDVASFLGIGAKAQVQALTSTKGLRWADMTAEQRQALMAYNREDAEVTAKVFLELHDVWRALSDVEKINLDWAVRAAARPVLRLNPAPLVAEIGTEKMKRREAVKAAGVKREVLMSNDKLAAELQRLGVEPPTKINSKGRETWDFAKTSEAFTALLEHPDERVRRLVEARITVKSTIAETRAAKLLRLAEIGEPVAAPLLYAGAVNTLRYSGAGGLNFQNLPKSGNIRKAVVPPDGHKLVVVDSSQIELRVCHWLAGEKRIATAIAQGRDPYCEFASDIYGVEVNPKQFEDDDPRKKEHQRMRQIGKIALLALQYGMGVDKYIDTVRNWTGEVLDRAEAQKVVDTFRFRFAGIKRLWYAFDDMLKLMAQGQDVPVVNNKYSWIPVQYRMYTGPHAMGHEMRGTMPTGVEFKYPDLQLNRETGQVTYYRPFRRAGTEERAYIWGGTAVENCTQGLSALIIRTQMYHIMLRFAAELGLPRESLAMQVHDEVVAVVPEEKAQAALDIMIEELSRTPPWFLPEQGDKLVLGAEGSIADNYGDAK